MTQLKSLPIEARIMPPLRGSDSNQRASSYNHVIPSGFARHPQRKKINCGGLQPAAAMASPEGAA